MAGQMSSEALGAQQSLFYVFGYTLAACMFVAIAPLMHRRFDTLIYKIGFPLLALGTMVVVAPPLENVGCFVSALGYRFIDITVWTLSVYLATAKSVPLSWITGWNTACLYLGMLAGQIVASVFIGLSGGAYRQLGVGIVSFAMMAAALYATNVFNNDKAWGVLRPSSERAVRPQYSQAVQTLSGRMGLTPRQLDVLSGLGLGKSMGDIAEELGISKQTVKVHARNLYAALGVHSQRELCDMVAGEERRIEERLS